MNAIEIIMNEEYEIPAITLELEEQIDKAIDEFNCLNNTAPNRKNIRHKLNELIDEYNDLREIKIFNKL